MVRAAGFEPALGRGLSPLRLPFRHARGLPFGSLLRCRAENCFEAVRFHRGPGAARATFGADMAFAFTQNAIHGALLGWRAG
jgi:hypothetical protein